ncbi:MAG: phosphotransferase [Pseudobdellovibrionaceae bacterium]|nr:phosphotransferase [Pseudobdellovibrionaceae bacterium]
MSGEPIGEDWSQRKFFRVRKGDKTAILVHSVPDYDPKAVAGHKLGDFIDIGKFLSGMSVSVPEIYATDLNRGMMLIEDFGDRDFVELVSDRNKQKQADAYRLATRCLMHLYKSGPSLPIEITDYSRSHIHKGRQRVVDWYLPAVLKRKNPDFQIIEYMSLWEKIEIGLPPVEKRFLHGDFHPGNLMYLPERVGYHQVGLIDFQGGMIGPAPYDLVNLLEDARRDVPEDIKKACLDQFVGALPPAERESFLAWYPVLAAQFHFRVIGQAIKLALRSDITRLMGLMPVLSRHIRKDLKNPLLAPMRQWFDDLGVSFDPDLKFDLNEIRPFIRPDAF